MAKDCWSFKDSAILIWRSKVTIASSNLPCCWKIPPKRFKPMAKDCWSFKDSAILIRRSKVTIASSNLPCCWKIPPKQFKPMAKDCWSFTDSVILIWRSKVTIASSFFPCFCKIPPKLFNCTAWVCSRWYRLLIWSIEHWVFRKITSASSSAPTRARYLAFWIPNLTLALQSLSDSAHSWNPDINSIALFE